MPRPIENGDLRGESLTDSEVASLPRHLFSELDEAARPAGHRTLGGVRHRRYVEIEIASGIEAPLLRRLNQGLDGDCGHPGFGGSVLPLTGVP